MGLFVESSIGTLIRLHPQRLLSPLIYIYIRGLGFRVKTSALKRCKASPIDEGIGFSVD